MSDEVSSFLRSVEQLKDRRDEEDEARSRELEEKILQERRERQARRAERARSISPQKSSPANTPPPSQHRHADSQTSEGLSLASSPVLESSGSPQSRSANHSRSDMMGPADYSTSPTKENESPYDLDSKRGSITSPSSAVPTRTPTLSWQRRPTSQASAGSKSRPLSMVAAENAAARSSTATPADQAEQPTSRDQIAQALGSKDPAWFRQTPDRGQGSAAYRRNQVEDEDRLDMSSVRAQLPGMSRASSIEPERDATPTRAESPGLRGKLGSPLPLTPAQRLDPPTQESIPSEPETPSIDRQIMSPPSGRTSPNRPISPTKGMGGFVQSAMMKRTDSVKRWSVTSPTGLQRADSVASARPNSPHRMSVQSSSRPTSMGRESSSRPSSSHADAAPLSVDTLKDTTINVEPSLPAEEDAKLPVSSSRTMDPRRWSPGKSSSWLESALNKPESPKPKPTPPANSQPSWMADLNKAKAQKATGQEGDLSRTASVSRNFEVKTGGLLRSSPMGINVKSPAARTYHSPSASIGGERTGLAALRGTLSASSSADDMNSSSGTPDKTSATSSPSTTKQKPETPPKKDFRTNLKTRPPPAGGDVSKPAEFQNVFGNLRRTKTQNYVAPDTLKDNILRGKAGLAVTGGPKPRERKDEFKDAILAKKADFNQAKTEGRGIKTNASGPSEKPIPEGLAKRLEMSRTGTISHKKEPSTSSASAEPPFRTPARSNTMSPVSKRDSAEVSQPAKPERELPSPVPTLHKETSAPARMQKPGGSALADRFNPALAGFLARGPPPMASNAGKDSEDSGSGAQASGSSQSEQPSGPGPQLTHMTKNRARGPKRRAPASATKPVATEQPETASTAVMSDTAADEKPASPIKPVRSDPLSPKPVAERISLADSSKKPIIMPKPAANDVISLVDSSQKKPVEEVVKPTGSKIDLVGSPKPTGRPRSPTKIHEQVAALAAKTQDSKSGHSRSESADLTSPATSPRKLDMKRMSKFLDESTPAEVPRPLSPSKTGGNRPLPEPRPLSPQKTGGRALPESPRKETPSEKVDSDPVVSVRSGAAMFGGASVAAKPKPSPISPPPKNINLRPPPSSASSRPLPTATTPGPKSPPPLSSPVRSPSKHASDVSAMFNDFFGNARPQRKYTVDAAEVLMSRPKPSPKVNTQQMQLFRISGDGKKQPVQASYERVLFEREMYLCAHSFTNEAGRRSAEVYFWIGDEVPQATAEDAEVFANREACALGGKLVKLQQGKESPEFIQALGGIVIVRRGSSNKYDSLAPEMLCGRRYLGQIAFDEVDFSPASLCSGFPYLITTQGKCYLWKGKGSDVDELSCARLIGMDLALMGELTEVEDGAEPAGFWDLFGGGSPRSGSAGHWRLKPNYDKYCGRLFCSDASSRQQIIELHPFSQADLHPAGIYVLDAFFEMYIVVGRRAQSQYASFHNALDFAQEYAILAAGAEDRPFVPVSTVVLEGIPRDLKSVFRKWADARSPTRTAEGSAGPTSPQQQQLKRGRSLRIVPLTQALQALAN